MLESTNTYYRKNLMENDKSVLNHITVIMQKKQNYNILAKSQLKEKSRNSLDGLSKLVSAFSLIPN